MIDITAVRPRLQSSLVARVFIAAALLATGWIHLLLAPEHLAESTILGLGFLASGLAQVALAGIVVWRPASWSLALVVVLNVTLIVIYAYAVLVGLPFGAGSEHDHTEAAGLLIGAGEPVDWYGGISKVAELTSAAIALALLAPKKLQNPLVSTD
jgi:peptidoglycan/LPS O-acetylase OafA/YrhL